MVQICISNFAPNTGILNRYIICLFITHFQKYVLTKQKPCTLWMNQKVNIFARFAQSYSLNHSSPIVDTTFVNHVVNS